MAEWVIPVEEETGIPLAIAPNENLGISDARDGGANWHHLVYPKSRPELRSDSGQALRLARVELVDIGDHVSFHHYFDEYMVREWEFPKSTAQRFGMTVLMAARYVPPRAIKVGRDGPSYVNVDEEMRERFWGEGVLKLSSPSMVYEFLKDFVLGQELLEIATEKEIEQFLLTKDDDERAKLGDALIGVAAIAATDGIRPAYLEAYKSRLILADSPPEPDKFLIQDVNMLGTAKRMRKARMLLRKNLAKQCGVELLPAA